MNRLRLVIQYFFLLYQIYRLNANSHIHRYVSSFSRWKICPSVNMRFGCSSAWSGKHAYVADSPGQAAYRAACGAVHENPAVLSGYVLESLALLQGIKTQTKYSAEGIENPGEADYNEDESCLH